MVLFHRVYLIDWIFLVLEVANGDYGNFTNVLEIKGSVNTWRTSTKEEDSMANNIPSLEYDEEEDDENKDNSPSEIYKLMILIKRSVKKMKRDWVRFTNEYDFIIQGAEHNFLFSKLNKNHCMHMKIFIYFS